MLLTHWPLKMDKNAMFNVCFHMTFQQWEVDSVFSQDKYLKKKTTKNI